MRKCSFVPAQARRHADRRFDGVACGHETRRARAPTPRTPRCARSRSTRRAAPRPHAARLRASRPDRLLLREPARPGCTETGHVVGCSKTFSTHTTARLRRNRDATPPALPHTRSYRGCRLEGDSNAQASTVDWRPVPRSGRRVRSRIHVPRPRQRNHRGAIALVEHGALDRDWSRGRPTCAGANPGRGAR
jgi:hypothetical protein